MKYKISKLNIKTLNTKTFLLGRQFQLQETYAYFF